MNFGENLKFYHSSYCLSLILGYKAHLQLIAYVKSFIMFWFILAFSNFSEASCIKSIIGGAEGEQRKRREKVRWSEVEVR